MATRMLSVCDICGAPTDRERIRLGWDLITYEADLCDEHGEALEQMVETVIYHGRRLGAPPTSFTPPAPKSAPREQVDTAVVRAWARKQGITVSDRGRIPEEVYARYLQRNR